MSRGKTVFVFEKNAKANEEKDSEYQTNYPPPPLQSASFGFVAKAPLRKNVAATLDRSDGCKAEANRKNTDHNEIDEHARANV